MERLKFIEDRSTGIEVVSLEQVRISYPPHTHVDHYVFGIVTEGRIMIRSWKRMRLFPEKEHA